MIVLEMYIDGLLFDTAKPYGILKETKYKVFLKLLIHELMSKHAVLLSKRSDKPIFILCGVPSCANNFVPLRHFN